MSNVLVSERVRAAWSRWLPLTRERCHQQYVVEGGDLVTHIQVCQDAAGATAARIARDIVEARPQRILDIGCSVGFNAFALKKQFPEASVVGIEPDHEALCVAEAMREGCVPGEIEFVRGVGEELPFMDGYFDLIVSHTVIEHVGDVPRSIREMSRVLASDGIIHLEAPNYIWPWEPHLGIIMPPLCPKPLIRAFARLQRRGGRAHYVSHLNLVYPRLLERLFLENGLTWSNRVEQKVRSAISGDLRDVRAYQAAAGVLALLPTRLIGESMVKIILKLKLYPSLLYTLRRKLSVHVQRDDCGQTSHA